MAAMSTLKPVGLDKYPAKQHARRVARNLEMPKGLILLKGAKNQFYPGSTEAIPFRQHRHFYYLTGCNEAGCWMTYDVAADKLTLWLPLPQQAGAAWNAEKTGPKKIKEAALQKHDVDEVKFVRQLVKGKPKMTNLRKMLKDHAAKEGSQFAFFKMPTKLVGPPLRKAMKEKRKLGLREMICKCRSRKDNYEIAQIKNAAAVSAEAHTDVMKALPGLKSEHEAEAVFLSSCIAQRAKGQAYAPVFGSGINGSQLLYGSNSADFENAQTLIVDGGAKWNEYASALTRTIPLNPSNPGAWPSAEVEMVYNAVTKIQEESVKQIAPGKKFLWTHWNAVHMAIDALLEMGILKGDHMEIFHSGAALAFFPHGLGHFVGLEAKDVAPPLLFQNAVVKNAGKGKQGPAGKKGPNAKAGPGPKKGTAPAAKGMDLKDLEAQDALTTPTLPIRRGPAMKKGSWGKTGPNAAKAVVNEKLGVMDPMPVDEKAGFEVIQKPVQAEKPTVKGPNMKPKAGTQGKGQGKKAAGPVKPKDKRFLRTRMVYRNYAAANPSYKHLDDSKVMPAYYSLRPRFCRAPCTPTAPLLQQGNVLAIEPGLYFNPRVVGMMMKNEKKAKFVNKEVLERFMPVGGVKVKDTVVVTEKGFEVLTREAPKGNEMVGLIREAATV